MPADRESEVEAVARAINPFAFSGEMLKLGCDGPWHYTGHSFHSVCGCGSSAWDQPWALRDKQNRAQDHARAVARDCIAALDRVRGPQGEDHEADIEAEKESDG